MSCQDLRVGKTDSTGTFTYLCDGTAPGSPLLSDGAAVYTPGLSERHGLLNLHFLTLGNTSFLHLTSSPISPQCTENKIALVDLKPGSAAGLFVCLTREQKKLVCG